MAVTFTSSRSKPTAADEAGRAGSPCPRSATSRTAGPSVARLVGELAADEGHLAQRRPHDAGPIVLVLGGQPVLPDVRRLDHVVVDRDDLREVRPWRPSVPTDLTACQPRNGTRSSRLRAGGRRSPAGTMPWHMTPARGQRRGRHRAVHAGRAAQGHEVAYNRWYERDHFYAGCLIGTGWFAGRRWVATKPLKDLRFPTDTDFLPDIAAGSYLATYWVVKGKDGDAIAWGSEQVQVAARERPHVRRARPHPHADVRQPLGRLPRRRRRRAARRSPSTTRSAGLVSVMVDRNEDVAPKRAFSAWLRDELLPATMAGTPWALTCRRSRRSRCPKAPRCSSPPTPARSGACCCCASSTADPRECWDVFDRPRRRGRRRRPRRRSATRAVHPHHPRHRHLHRPALVARPAGSGRRQRMASADEAVRPRSGRPSGTSSRCRPRRPRPASGSAATSAGARQRGVRGEDDPVGQHEAVEAGQHARAQAQDDHGHAEHPGLHREPRLAG